jgi:cytosine deaminase
MALERMVSHGTTAIRSHVNLTEAIGTTALRALMEVRDRAHEESLADVQLVALVSCPLSGGAGAVNRRLLQEALDLGADVAGGAPHLDPDPRLATSVAIDIAVTHGVPVDLHVDETLDPAALHVRDLGRLAAGAGLQGRVVASHCVSLGVQPVEVQRQVGAELAAAGVAVVALPQTNLYLQARTVRTSPPRAITALRTLLEAGVVVAAGADNARDPFCSMGRLDALETASLLVMAAHLTPVEAWEACTTGARRAMGLPVVELVPGSPAEIMCVEGHSLADAIAGAGERRLVVHRGRVVARTRVERTLIPATSA